MQIEDEDPFFSKDMLKVYYQRYFPNKLIKRWLMCCDRNDDTIFQRREFSFTLEGDIYCRFESFIDEKTLKNKLVQYAPIKIDIGAVYTLPPNQKNSLKINSSSFKPQSKEFVIDIDMTDYDPIRTCCKGADICPKCWKFMQAACLVLDKGLRDDFGFDNLMWVFSGRRGIHCWVSDIQAQKMNNLARSAIIEYFSIVSGNESQDSQIKNNILKKHLHPAIQRAYKILKPFFIDIVIQDQNIFAQEKSRDAVTKIFVDDSQIHEIVQNLSKKFTDSLSYWKAIKTVIKTYRQTRKNQSKQNRKNNKKISRRLKYAKYEIIFQFLYPRLDVKVSTEINHLLKSPYCIHPKTGKLCVTFASEDILNFQPFNVPTLKGLYNEYKLNKNIEDQELFIIETSIYPYLKHFESFLNTFERNNKIIKEDLSF